MQHNKLIDDLKEFKKTDWLVKEFYEEYCNLNNREDDGSFEELVDFSFTTLLKTSSDTITNTETITFNGFKLQKFKSKTKLVINEFEKLIELKGNNICQHFILRLKDVLKDFYKDPEFKEYVVELNTVIERRCKV
jgi:succinate dehydrogenase flavin-adding protein (antitoxin of CptAB toxin-antitoxin module)